MDVGHGFVGRTGEHGRPFRPGDAAQPEAEGLPIGRRRSLHVTGHAAAEVPSFTEFYRVLPSFTEFFRVFLVAATLFSNRWDLFFVPILSAS